jgi:ABC-type nitrate/sulfonate/bicarbonate transport system permease component
MPNLGVNDAVGNTEDMNRSSSVVFTVMRITWQRIVPPAIAVASVLFLWQLGVVVTGGIGFASPLEVLNSLSRFVVTPRFWTALFDTVGLTLVGLSLGLIIALVIGLLLGANRILSRSSRATMNFFRVIPSVVLIPLFLVSLGNSAAMVIWLTALVSSFKLVVFVIRGVSEEVPRLDEGARILGIHPAKRAVLLHIPAATETIMTGLRLTIARAYGAVVVVGLTTSGPGLGDELMRAKTAVNTPDVFAYAIVAGIIGTVFFFAFSWLDRRLVFWRRAT